MPKCSLLLLLLLGVPCLGEAAEPTQKPTLPEPTKNAIDFQRDIQPIFAQRCLQCHSAAKRKGGLSLATRNDLLEGGNTGKVVNIGKSAESRLIHVIAGLDTESPMPPDSPPLKSADVAKIRAWIDQGLHWNGNENTTSDIIAKSSHWAFQPINNPPLPQVKNPTWVRNSIDTFILANLEKQGIAPSPEASKTVLIRRLYLDLLGLPPHPSEVKEFLEDTANGAYERLVDRVLKSPHYGERWARHWLDAARYADSDGYEKDTGRPWAWRYRQWVIEALNRDLSFDQFAIEQLAGDLLPNATTQQKIATGFHRNTLTNKEGGVDQEQFRVEAVVDRVNTTGKVFLGITIGCAQCHDHKYDPFTMREYYQLFAYFNSDREVDIDAPLDDETGQLEQRKAAHAKRKQELMRSLEEYQKKVPALQASWEAGLKPEDIAKLPKNVADALKTDQTLRTPGQKKLIADHYAKTDTRLTQLNKAISDHDKAIPGVSKAPTLALGAARKTHVHIRGDFLRKGVEVFPATPASISGAKKASESKNRLELAKWIVDPINPLTRRVIANWIWHKYFGRGIVTTLEDFGTQGDKPANPELLDHLATQLLEKKWSLKAFHRLIVTSATYRQSSKTRPELQDRDPNNIWLARQNRLRLEAEILRDSALTASGLLVPKIGGPSVRPPQPAGISELTYAGSAKWVESTGADRYRRGLYTWFQRTSPYPMLMTFDSPDSNVCVVRRERSNTPLQALTLLNDTVFFECAQGLAKRILSEKKGESLNTQLEHAFLICLARKPEAREHERLLKLHGDLLALARTRPEDAQKLAGMALQPSTDSAESAAMVALARVLLNLDEFVNRE